MSISQVSNSSIFGNMRTTIQRARNELVQREQEAVTGRHADVNLELAGKAGVPVALRIEQEKLTSIISENSLVTNRLEATQAALGNIVSSNQFVTDALTTAMGSQDAVGVAVEQTRTVMMQFTSTLNFTEGGRYLFAGINTDVRPLDDFMAEPAGPARAAVETAFTTAFGFPPGDPLASTIDPASMEAFLNGDFAQLFEEAQWSGTWSSASDRNIRSRIAPQMMVESGVNANEAGFRELAKSYVAIIGLEIESLSGDTGQTVLEWSLQGALEGVNAVNGTRTKVGLTEQQISVQNEALDLRMQVNSKYLTAIEGVDQYEAAVRLNELTQQIEASYSLTSRLQSLSLLNYV